MAEYFELAKLFQLTGQDARVPEVLAQAAAEIPSLKASYARLYTLATEHDARLVVASLPADTLAQRPDLFAAQRDIAAARAELGGAQAQRYPRIALSGSIGALHYNAAGSSGEMATWSIGPLALSVPLFDGGRREAGVTAAQARYEESVALYRAQVRQAVREVEQALVTLQSTQARVADATTAEAGYRA